MAGRPAGAVPGTDIEREEQFLELFLAHDRRIHGFILALVPNWSDADDLLQETSAVLWRRLDEFEPGTDFAAWAMSIARYQILNYRRRERSRGKCFSDRAFDALAEQATSTAASADARRDALEDCLAKLSDRERELVRLRYQPGATTREVADRLGRPLKSVYKTLNRVHEALLLCVRRSLGAGVAG
jgi:RNA polymerase sigma-70 factor (ECF subfamily)